ncbi:MAG: hypothetical protein H0X73_07850 [Chthoniobacterales bacterium]|nr:hypothetical protein [Chthoniobacterales bacterium]
MVPSLLDLYLGKTGYDGQQTEEADDPNKPNDLFEPLPRDHGAHGRFDDRAFGSSPAFWAVKHRAMLGAVAGGFLAFGIAAVANACARRCD